MRGITTRGLSSSQVSQWHGSESLTIPSRQKPFHPGAVGGLQFWAAADLDPRPDGASVATVPDLSGNSRTFTGTNLIWSDNATPAGGPVYTNNPASTYWSMKRAAWMSSAAGEIVLHVKLVNFGENNLMQWSGDATREHWPFTGDSNVYEGFGSSARKNAGPIASSGNWYTISVYSAASDWGIYLNGSLAYSTATNTVGWGTADHLIGSTFGGSACKHQLAEVCVFDRKLSSGERASMVGYLNRHAA